MTNPFDGEEVVVTVELQNLVLTRPLCVIDLESTGTNVREDRVVEVAVLSARPDQSISSYVRRVNPGRPIPSAATAVHGIRDADVANSPTFATVAPELFALLDGRDLAGFGVVGFDLPLLVAEFARAGLVLPVAGRAVIDALAVFRRREPRDLTAAVRHYLGEDRCGAHTALADATNALAVLDAQVLRYGLPRSPAELHAALVDVDVGGAFRRGPDGEVVLAFGKYRGRPLAGVAAEDPGYLRWVLRQPFLDDAHALVRAALTARFVPS